MIEPKAGGVAAPRPMAWEAANALSPSRPLGIAVWTLCFSLLTAAGAYVAVPLGFTPVPITLQTLFVLLSGGVLGPVAGAASQLLYLGMGVSGVPVFALGGGGWPWLLGPTGGYLLAFPLAAALVGWISRDSKEFLLPALGLAAGTAAIFALGASWVAAISDRGPAEIFAIAVQPFLLGAVLKGAIALAVIRAARGRAR